MSQPANPATPPAPPAGNPAPPAAGQPAQQPTPPATGTGQQGQQDPNAPLGEPGLRALQEERRLKDDALRQNDELQKQIDALSQQGQTDQEKAVTAAKAEGVTEGRGEYRGALINAKIEAAAATAGFHDPQDAVANLAGRSGEIQVTKDGVVDATKITELVKELATRSPHLVNTGQPGAKPLPGQGQHQTPPTSGRDAGLAEARKRFGDPAKRGA